MAVSCAGLCALVQVQREMMMVMGRRREVVVGTTTLAAVRGKDVMEKIGRRMLAVKAGRRGGSGEGTTVTVLPAPKQQQQQQQQAASQAAKTTTTMTATRGGGGGGASGGAGGDANKRNATYIYGAGAAALALSSLAAYYAIAPSRSKATKEKEEEAAMEAELDSAAAGMVQRADEGAHEELNDSGRDEGRQKEQEVKRMMDEEEERRGGVETSGDLGEPVVVMMAGDGMETQDETKADVEKRKSDEATAADSAPFEMQAATLIDDAISAAQVDASAFEETIESHSARAVAPSHDTSVAEEEGVLAAAGEREDGDAAAVSMNAAADDMPRTQKKEEEKEKEEDTWDAARDDDRIDGDNVTLEDLMQRSVRANLHAAGDWQAVNVAMKQAASDLGLFTRILEKERAGHDAEKARLTSTLEARDAAIESLRKDIDAVRIEGDENQRKALEEQKVALDLAKATAIIEERSQRTVEMDGIRGELNVLAEAFDLRRAETKARHDLHQLSLACFALDWSRGRGAPLAAAADAVKRFANGDPLIEAAIDAMPKVACERGALTQSQLRERFSRVRSSAASVSLIPLGGKGGIFAHSIAWLASMLRVREEAHTTGTHMGTEATLALAESLLVEGKIVKAIAVMEEGFKDSAASKIIQDWVFEARLCASVDAILNLTRAHAMIAAAHVA